MHRGWYRQPDGPGPARIATSWRAGVALHEYVHHLQIAMPEVDALFRQLHRRRTRGEQRVPVGSVGEIGRIDQYVDPYMGREYDSGEDPKEVWAMAMHMLFHHIEGTDYTKELILDDPELLDLVLGVLFRYDP